MPVAVTVGVTESIAAGEVVGAIAIAVAGMAEQVTAGDITEGSAVRAASVTELAATGEQTNGASVRFATATETVTAVDSATTLAATSGAVTESLTGVDQSAAAALRGAGVTESMMASETVFLIAMPIFVGVVEEIAAIDFWTGDTLESDPRFRVLADYREFAAQHTGLGLVAIPARAFDVALDA